MMQFEQSGGNEEERPALRRYAHGSMTEFLKYWDERKLPSEEGIPLYGRAKAFEMRVTIFARLTGFFLPHCGPAHVMVGCIRVDCP
jgi:hypothetical protein